MEDDSYISISENGEGLYKEKGSKFLGFSFSVKKEEDVKRHLNSLKKQFYDARHYCYAFVIGKSGNFYRAGDDGEPANSAGAPILGQIRSHNLSDVLVVVVRYFGGTKLGVPGLIHAYKTAASEALSSASKEIIYIKKQVEFKFEYKDMNEVMRWVRDFELEIKQQDFQISCELVVLIRASKLKDLLKHTEKLHTVKVKVGDG